ncbi:hypothetical protein EMPS_10029 [Entomortierella parvispora]|uniref:PH domain-containing protein n=1 Tax=Entomortierella parvispora TaxID=205924 RepID=A0A9P3HJ55_9FUNG|nr:hypothetical protein EMPS_10029 [Entomortierella parvispora]
MPIAISTASNRSQPDLRPPNRLYSHSDSKGSTHSVNNLHSASSGPAHPHWDHPRGFNSSPSPTLMGTDDESSSASIRQWPRQLNKGGTAPSPLGNGTVGGGSSSMGKGSNTPAGLSSFSFLSSEKTSGTAGTDSGAKPATQLRVRHLERDLSYSGYLTKFSSRTFFSRKQWKRRYFILHQKSLHCFKSSDPQHSLLESLTLCSDTIICVTDAFAGKRFCLEISCPGEKSWYVLADTATEMSGWLRELKGTVNGARNLQADSRPGTMYSSDSLALSDTSSSSTAVRIPDVPALPGQFGKDGPAHSLGHLHPSGYSLNPPPRPITPKPLLPSNQIHSNRAQPLVNQHQQQQQQQHQTQSLQPQQQQQYQQPDPRRRRGSSVSTGQTVSDYASFGSVMEKAEALAVAQQNSPSSTWSLPTKSGVTTGNSISNGSSNYGTVPRSKRDSTISTVSTMSVMSSSSTLSAAQSHSQYRSSVMVDMDRSGANTILPNRTIQRAPTGPSVRAMSPIPSSRPLSPTFNRTSPRNSLVISPPPRSIHRPVSVSIRHSTQILPLPQNPASGLPAQVTPSSSSNRSTQPSRSGLPAPPNGQHQVPGNLSRITSIRHQRELPQNRQSMVILPSENLSGPRVGSGSLQERVQRSSSRASILTPGMSSVSRSTIPDSRPLSPVPLVEFAPKVPLPEPPRSGSNSPSKASNGRASSPRLQSPDLIVPARSKARARSQSQEAALVSSQLDDLSISPRPAVVSPASPSSASPRLSTILTHQKLKQGGITNNNNNNNTQSHKQMSLPINTMYVLPAPPTHQVPTEPPTARGPAPTQRHLGGNLSLRPLSTAMSGVPSLGGGVARRSMALSSPSESKRDSILSPRLSTVILPPEPTKAVPPPPTQNGFPAPPVGALPLKPRVKQDQSLLGFGSIVEEEEEDEEDEEYESKLEFEELVAAKEAAVEQQDLDQETADETPETRPEYYATKERVVVEYIFPSESLSP